MGNFASQAFLLDFIRYIPNEVDVPPEPSLLTPVGRVSTSKETKDYEHIMRVEGDPTACMNKLLYNSIQSSRTFDSFSPHQLSYLTPKIEIWKNKPTGKKDPKWISIPFPINDATTVSSIVNSLEGRGTDVGLKSISWQDTGTDTAYAGVTMKGTIALTFQSFESLFMDRDTGQLDEDGNAIFISFAELTTNVPTQLKPEVAGDIPKSFYDAEIPPFEIQLRIGWSVPDDAKNEIFTPGELSDIGDAISVLNILTNRVNLSIKDGGKIDLTCEFHGRLETAMHTQRYDLFMIDPDSLTKQQREQDRKVLQDILTNLKKARDEPNIKDTESKKAQEIDKNIQITSQELFNIKSETLEEAWGKFLGKLASMTTPGVKDQNTGRLFYMDINDEVIEDYQTLLNIREQSKLAKRRKKLFEEGKSTRAIVQKTINQYDQKRSTIRKGIVETIEGADHQRGTSDSATLARAAHDKISNANATEEDWKAIVKKHYKLLQSDATKKPGPDDTTRINYFFLGDLFEAAMDIIINRPESHYNCDNPVSGKNNIRKKQLEDKSRLMLGDIYIIEAETGYLKTYSIADLPIALDTFLLWWEKVIVAQRRTSLPLRYFLSSMCSQLIKAVLAVQGSPLEGNRRPSSRIALASIDLPAGGYVDEVWRRWKKKISINHIADIRKEHGIKKDGKKFEIAQFIYLYTDEKPQPKDSAAAQFEDNFNRGIPHLYVGNTDGLVKTINFSRTKIAGHVESSILRSVQAGRAFKSQLLSSDKYDATIKMFGNPFYKPGMQIYVDPRSLGLGYSVGAKWATDLGLGGLYTIIGVRNDIESGKYETTLTCKSEVGLGLRKLVQPKKSTTSKKSISSKATK